MGRYSTSTLWQIDTAGLTGIRRYQKVGFYQKKGHFFKKKNKHTLKNFVQKIAVFS